MMHSHVVNESAKVVENKVLILVVMDDALAPLSNDSSLGVGEVLILVVMDDALALL